jgi:hypothetical protein
LVSHYFGELPGVEPNLQRTSEVASDKVASESPQQQAPKSQTTLTNISTPELVVPELAVPEQPVPEKTTYLSNPETVSEHDFMITLEASDDEMEIKIEKSVPNQPSTSNQTPTSISSQPSSSSHLAIQSVAPTKPSKVPSPPTIFLDSTLLTDVCEKIFRDLNKLI